MGMMDNFLSFLANIFESSNADNASNPDEEADKPAQGSSRMICKCPCCEDGQIIAGKDFYICTNKPAGCRFSFPRVLYSAKITEDHIRTLAAGKKTKPIRFIWSNGESGIARVYGTVVSIGNGHYRFSRGYHFLA